MPFKKGFSGNVRGRPAKTRALTEMLALRGEHEILYENVMQPASQAVAAMMWHFIVVGCVEFPDGSQLRATTATEWFLAAKWVYDHIDGPARTESDASIEIHIVREDDEPEALRDGD